jgi:outer membrane protein OmpA-like peptidoglycan-associated protein
VTKYVVGGLVLVLIVAAALLTAIHYVTHRVKQRAATFDAPPRPVSQNTAKRSTPAPAQSLPVIPGSRDVAKPSDVSTPSNDQAKLETPANPAAQTEDPPLSPEAQVKALADAGLVSQAIYRNLDKAPSRIPSTELPDGTGPISMPTPDGYTWTSNGAKVKWAGDDVRIDYGNGGGFFGECPVIKRPPSTPMTPPTPATGNQEHDWALQYERTENGPEADLEVRTGDINNLGFGWPADFDPFSGKPTPTHPYPWKVRREAAAGTDRIILGSGFRQGDVGYDGYSRITYCGCPKVWADCQNRLLTMPAAIPIQLGQLPSKINEILVQMFVDDFQAASYHSHFQVSLNETRIPSMEYALNSLDQSGPIGKLLSLPLLPEYWPILQSGQVNLLIDDPTTHIGDGYAVDFVRILVNPHNFKYQVSLLVKVVDADRYTPISGATVSAALQSTSTDKAGKGQLQGLPAGLVVVTAAATNYDENSVPVDLVAGQKGTAEIPLHRHHEDTAALEKELAKTGVATIYGIHFDTDSAKLRGDSLPALNAVLGLINNHPDFRWAIAGHTDNQGNATHNQTLSEKRSASVILWLKEHGIDLNRMEAHGYGATRPVADNATANGRALNRRVEVAILK